MEHGGRPNLPAITGLRFFLALLVVAFHASGSDGTLRLNIIAAPQSIASLVGTGYAAVSFFFVLSGFVLAYGYNLNKPWTAKQRHRFWIARLARLYPVYLLGLLLSLPLAALAMFKEPGHPLAQNAATVLATPLLMQAWLPGSSTVWNGPGWSLSAETFFYLVFPFAGLRLWRVSGSAAPLMLGLVWVLATTSITVLSTIVTPDLWANSATQEPLRSSANAFVKFSPLLHLPAFITGILTAKYFVSLQGSRNYLRPGRGAYLFVPALVVELAVATHASRVPYPLMHDCFLLPVHAVLITGLALGGGLLPNILGMRPFLLLGQSSYALYLLHLPIDRYWVIVTKHVLHRQLYGPSWFCVYCVLCIAVSCCVFFVVEDPMRRKVLARWASLETRMHLSTVRLRSAGNV